VHINGLQILYNLQFLVASSCRWKHKFDLWLRIQNACIVLLRQITFYMETFRSCLEGCMNDYVFFRYCLSSTLIYSQIMKGSPVERIVVFLPIVSIRSPPAIPPNRADSGIKLPIHDFWNSHMYRWLQHNLNTMYIRGRKVSRVQMFVRLSVMSVLYVCVLFMFKIAVF